MKVNTRRVAAIVLATALSLPVFAAGISRDDRDRSFDISERIVRILRQMQQKFFGGAVSNSDGLQPPKP